MGSSNESPPNKRLKTQEKEELVTSSSMEDNNNCVSDCCGICLVSSDDGNSIRGQIDSCDHYFCYVCILEWAKVESRCPMCKRRFTSICRAPKQGIFSHQRIVHVPKRDQVYHIDGNATVGPPDPYSQVQCSVCHTMEDESYLLLCDLCDSASHTFCVGLGYTVPEGDWFCNDCALSRTMHEQASGDTDGNAEDIHGNSSKPEANISILDLVRERPLRRFTSPSRESAAPVVSRVGNGVENVTTELGSHTHENEASRKTGSGARTLRRCRNVRKRIQAIRENWDALRSGSLSFSSRSQESGASSSRSVPGKPMSDRPVSQLQFSPSNNQQLPAVSSCPSSVRNRGFYDVDKAWKMMDEAKMVVQKKSEPAGTTRQASSGLREAPDTTRKLVIAKHQPEARNPRSTGVQMQDEYNSLKRTIAMSTTSKFEKQKQNCSSCQEVSRELLVVNAPMHLQSSSSHNVQTEPNHCTKIGAVQVRGNTGSLSRSTNEHGKSFDFTALAESAAGPSKSSRAKPKSHTLTSSKVHAKTEKSRLGNDSANRKSGQDDNAKSEIQSLVKLNLKLLSKDKHLDVDAFKDIARISTHTILAACGLEHRKSEARHFPSCICDHGEQSHQLHKSTLMSNSCRECFFNFVKDVVNSIMRERAV